MDATILRTDAALVRRLLPERLRFLDFSVGLVLSAVHQREIEYGYDSAADVSLYLDDRTLDFWKPLISVDLGVTLPRFGLSLSAEATPGSITETVRGSRTYSDGAAVSVPFETTDLGFEARFAATARLTFPEAVDVTLGAGYRRHVGYSQTFDAALGSLKYVYARNDLTFALLFTLTFLRTLGILDQNITVGAQYALDVFSPLPKYGVPGYTDGRVKYVFGLSI